MIKLEVQTDPNEDIDCPNRQRITLEVERHLVDHHPKLHPASTDIPFPPF